MSAFSSWIQSFRLRTLPLAAAVILAGAGVSMMPGFDWIVFTLSLLTAFLLQILSNLSNDLGDFEAGTDNAQRIGPKRTLQQGLIQPLQMKRAMLIVSVLSLISGISLLLVAFGTDKWIPVLAFLSLGLLCILAALKYTVGKSAYGYKGLGDIAVFVFFGLTGVMGSAFLYTRQWNPEILWVAVAFGGYSTAVLNINNMRDIANDEASGKMTLAVRLGLKRAKIYHVCLVVVSSGSLLFYACTHAGSVYAFLFVPVIPVVLFHTFKLIRETSDKMDPYLKRMALGAFFIAVLFFAGRMLMITNV